MAWISFCCRRQAPRSHHETLPEEGEPLTLETRLPSVRRALLRGFLLVAGLLPLGAQQTPVINKFSDLNAGAILAGASAGTATLNSPSGTRSSTGGTAIGTSVGVMLGSLTLTGRPGNSWAINAGSTIPFTLTRAGGGTLTVTAVDFEPSATNTGTFPASGTTSMFYLGVAMNVGSSATSPQGLYTGSFSLLLRDTSNNRSSTASFTVTVRVDPVITLTKTANLSFGDVFAGASAGTVVLSPAGARSTTGGLLLGNLSPAGAAAFTVTGAANATYAVALPASITLTGPAGTLLVSPFTSTPSLTGLLSPGGLQQLQVGATLNVAANQADGDYSGVFAVTVTYN
jgi:hypothetical protein